MGAFDNQENGGSSLCGMIAGSGITRVVRATTAPIRWLFGATSSKTAASGTVLVREYSAGKAIIYFPRGYKFKGGRSRPLPTLFVMSGSGPDGGKGSRDDDWNSYFASSQQCLVVSLQYPPGYANKPFLELLRAFQSLFLEVCSDERLPMDRTVDGRGYSRTAMLGHSTGARLALALPRMENIGRHDLAPAGTISMNAPTYIETSEQLEGLAQPEFLMTLGSEEGEKEPEQGTKARDYVEEIGSWLKTVVWQLE